MLPPDTLGPLHDVAPDMQLFDPGKEGELIDELMSSESKFLSPIIALQRISLSQELKCNKAPLQEIFKYHLRNINFVKNVIIITIK